MGVGSLQSLKSLLSEEPMFGSKLCVVVLKFLIILNWVPAFSFCTKPWWLRQWRICPQSWRPRFEAWIRKIPWRRGWQCGKMKHCCILTWKNPWTEEPGVLQSTGLERVRHDWVTNTFTFTLYIMQPVLGGTSLCQLKCLLCEILMETDGRVQPSELHFQSEAGLQPVTSLLYWCRKQTLRSSEMELNFHII